MTPLDYYDEKDFTCIAGDGQRPEAVHPMVPPASEQTAFTGAAAAKEIKDEKPGSGNIETTGPVAFQGYSGPASAAAQAGTQANDILSEVQRQRSRGEELVNEAHSLHQQARIARARREYDAAAELEREAIAKLRQGNEVIANPQLDNRELRIAAEKMNSGKDISFGWLTLCERACAEDANGVKNAYLLHFR